MVIASWHQAALTDRALRGKLGKINQYLPEEAIQAPTVTREQFERAARKAEVERRAKRGAAAS